jgi:hypothetical protein
MAYTNQDSFKDIFVTSAFNAATISSATTTAGIEIDRGSDDLCFLIHPASVGASTDLVAPLIEHSDVSGSGYTTVPADFLSGTIAGASFTNVEDNGRKKIGYLGNKRYVRLSFVTTGSSVSTTPGATAMLRRRVMPQVQ